MNTGQYDYQILQRLTSIDSTLTSIESILQSFSDAFNSFVDVLTPYLPIFQDFLVLSALSVSFWFLLKIYLPRGVL